MPCCLLLIIALLGPRIAIVLLALFSNYLGAAYPGLLIPLLGFVFMPFTTLAYAWSINSFGGVSGLGAVAVIVAVLLDFGVIGGGAAERRKRHV